MLFSGIVSVVGLGCMVIVPYVIDYHMDKKLR